MTAVYSYDTAFQKGNDESVALVNYLFEHPTPVAFQFNETLTLRTSNQDNSLVYNSTFNLPGRLQEVVEADGTSGGYFDAAVDANYALHTVHTGGGNLNYARKVTGEWVSEAAAASGGHNNSTLAIDAGGFAHIIYSSNGYNQGTLSHLTNAGGTWASEPITTGGEPDLVIDSAGNLNIVYYQYDGSQWDLYYGIRESGLWTFEKLADNIVWQGPSIAITRDDRIHIAYQDKTNREAWYVTSLNGGAWDYQLIDNDGADVGYGIKIAASFNADNVFVAYAADGRYIRVAQCCYWYYDIAADMGEDTGYPRVRLSVDPWGWPHVLFERNLGEFSNTRYARKINFDEWSDSVINNDWTNYMSLASSERFLHFLFQDYKGDAMHMQIDVAAGNKSRVATDLAGGAFARAPDGSHRMVTVHDFGANDDITTKSNASGVWQTEFVLNGEVVNNPVITVDAAGTEHLFWEDAFTNPRTLMYYDSSAGYAVPITTIDDNLSPVITSRGAGDVAIVFVGPSPDYGLHVMWRENGGAWSSRLIEPGYAAEGHFVAVDPDGNVHLVYADYDDTGNVNYVSNAQGSWQSTYLMYSNDWYAVDNAIAIDSGGGVHILFSDWNEYDTKYFTYKSGVWSTEILNEAWWTPRIAVGDSGDVHITLDGGGLFYQYKDSLGSWETISLESGYLNTEYVLMVHGDDVDVGYFDEAANVLVDDITGVIPVSSIQQAQAQ